MRIVAFGLESSNAGMPPDFGRLRSCFRFALVNALIRGPFPLLPIDYMIRFDLPMSLAVRLSIATFVLLSVPAATPAMGAEWPDEYRAGRFLCHADFPLAMDRSFLSSMTPLSEEIARQLQIRPRDELIHLFLFHQKSTYQAYLQQYFPEVPSRKALFIKGRGPGMVFAYRGQDFETDVRHECAHALLNASLPMVPLWLDEGLAEYYEVAPEDRSSGSPHQAMIKWNAKLGHVPDLEKLEQIRKLSEMNSGHYRNAWAWVHFMLHGPESARQELRAYLADIAEFTPPGQLSRRLRIRLPDLEQQFLEHFKTWP